MRLKKVLQPEVVLGLRDWDVSVPNLHSSAMYQEMIQDMRPITGGGWFFPDWIREKVKTDPLAALVFNAAKRTDLCLSKKFELERPPIFHSPREFLQALMKIDKDIPIEALPDRFFAYFSFAEDTVWDGEDFVQGMYVFIGSPTETLVHPDNTEWHGKKALWGSYYTQPSEKRPGVEVAYVLMPLNPGKVADNITFKEAPSPNTHSTKPDVWRLGLNLALYVNSVGCELVNAPPVEGMRPSVRKERAARGEIENHCKLPVKVVSWNYHRRFYSKDATWVETFPRWQRCGPELSQVKLVWVQPHERRFKNPSPSNQ
jgi:hypothetical protein